MLDPDPHADRTTRPQDGRPDPAARGARNAARAGTVRTVAVAGAIVSLGTFSALAAVNSDDDGGGEDIAPAVAAPAQAVTPAPAQNDFFTSPGAGLAPAAGGGPDARSGGS
jgi:hypothetical protein